MPMCKSMLCTAFALGLFLGVAGCGDSPQQLFDTAQFEELQKNHSHARKLYERIVQEHPDSDFARKAALRLAELKKKSGQ